MLRFYFFPVLLIFVVVLFSGCAASPVYTRAQVFNEWWATAAHRQ